MVRFPTKFTLTPAILVSQFFFPRIKSVKIQENFIRIKKTFANFPPNFSFLIYFIVWTFCSAVFIKIYLSCFCMLEINAYGNFLCSDGVGEPWRAINFDLKFFRRKKKLINNTWKSLLNSFSGKFILKPKLKRISGFPSERHADIATGSSFKKSGSIFSF